MELNYPKFQSQNAGSPGSYDAMRQNAQWKKAYDQWEINHYNGESIHFLAAVEAYMNNPSWPEADQIVAKYLAGNAKELVNIDGNIVAPILSQCQAHQRSGKDIGRHMQRIKDAKGKDEDEDEDEDED